jgi:YHS domain-containing protein
MVHKGENGMVLAAVQGQQSARRVLMMTIDPVCGMEVDEQETDLQTQYAGKKYSFCSEECLAAFERQPSKYSRAAKAA